MPALGLLARGIGAEPDFARAIRARGGPSTRRGERRGRAHGDAPRPLADVVLIDPASGAAGAQPNAESGEVIIEEGCFALVLRQRQGADGLVGQAHFASVLAGQIVGRRLIAFDPSPVPYQTSDIEAKVAVSQLIPCPIPFDRKGGTVFQAYDEGSIPFTRSTLILRPQRAMRGRNLDSLASKARAGACVARR